MQQNTCTTVCWSTSCNIWLPFKRFGFPATVICILPWNSYQVHTSNGSTYHRMWRHLHECSIKAANTVPSGITATSQALSRPHFIAAQPASSPPAICMQLTSAAPATLATQMKQAPAVPAMPATQEECPSTDAYDIPFHTCAATKIWPCLHGTKMPGSRRSRNSRPGLSMDSVFVMHHCIHTQ